MKKTLLVVFLSLCAVSFLSAVDADSLYRDDRFVDCKSELLSQLSLTQDPSVQAELLWKLSRVQVSLGDLLDDEDKKGRFAAYEEGEEYANRSIALKPTDMAYLWKASNIGRWGQTKGPLDSLGKAKGMKEDILQVIDTFGNTKSAEAWYVLACLYDQLPGSPLSFGNKNYGISYIRSGVDSIPSDTLYPGHYLALAEMLYERNWDVKKRKSNISKMEKKWKGETLASEKYKYYEGKEGIGGKPFYSSVTLEKMSDRQEAAMVVQYALEKYKVWKDKKPSMDKEVKELRKLFDEWT